MTTMGKESAMAWVVAWLGSVALTGWLFVHGFGMGLEEHRERVRAELDREQELIARGWDMGFGEGMDMLVSSCAEEGMFLWGGQEYVCAPWEVAE